MILLWVGSVEGDRDTFAGSLERFDAVLQPGWEYQQMARLGLEGNADAVADPREIDSWRFVHCDGGPARVAKINFSAFHVLRDFDVISGRHETTGVTMKCVEIARPVHIYPATNDEFVLFLAFFRAEVI